MPGLHYSSAPQTEGVIFKTEGTVFPNKHRPRLANNMFLLVNWFTKGFGYATLKQHGLKCHLQTILYKKNLFD